MKNILATRACALIAASVTFTAFTSGSHAQTYYFDFGSGQSTSFDDNSDLWNTIPNSVSMSNTQTFDFIYDTTGELSLLRLEMVSRFNGENGDGTQASGIFPNSSTRDSMYGNTATWQSLSNITPKFKLSGLDPTKPYKFSFYASRMLANGTDDRTTQYVVTGSAAGSTELNALNNVSGVAEVLSIMPAPVPESEFGEVLIELFPGATNNNQYNFTYLGVLKVEAIPEPTAALMLASGVGILALRRRRSA